MNGNDAWWEREGWSYSGDCGSILDGGRWVKLDGYGGKTTYASVIEVHESLGSDDDTPSGRARFRVHAGTIPLDVWKLKDWRSAINASGLRHDWLQLPRAYRSTALVDAMLSTWGYDLSREEFVAERRTQASTEAAVLRLVDRLIDWQG